MSPLPSFLVKKVPKHKNLIDVRRLLGDPSIHTVCEGAKCPNLGECFSRKTLTFMILGNICTRNCAFCAVEKGKPDLVDPDEPRKIKEAAEKLNLQYVVVTSVTRDDLPDSGASQFVKVIKALKPKPVEVLIPDLKGSWDDLKKIIEAGPAVINHNVETVSRLYPEIRNKASYSLSLELLRKAKTRDIYTKSGFMVGLGEDDREVISLLGDLRAVGCDIVTIGQYLSPSKNHIKPVRYVHPETFEWYSRIGERMGFLSVFSGPFVRSSYKAEEILWKKPKD